MKLVVDTNILIVALIRDSLTRTILLHPYFEFFIPEYALVELQKYINLISEKSGLEPERIEVLLSLITQNITVVPREELIEAFSWAEELIGDVDKKDIPFLALATVIKADGIWTMDKHFYSQDKVKIWKTEDLQMYMNALDSD
jgi:predicted nucleic acid-binding protein